MLKKSIVLSVLILFIFALTFGQDNPKTALRTSEKSEIIGKILDLLSKNYVFPETAQKVETLVHEKLKKNEYEKINDAEEFALRLTADLQFVSRGLHLNVMFSPEVLPAESKIAIEPLEQSREKFGVAKNEILKGIPTA